VRVTFTAAASVLAVLLSGCGSGGGSDVSQGNPAVDAPSITLNAGLTLSGAVSLSGSFTDEISTAASAATCQEAAKGYYQDGQRYDPPRPVRGVGVGGHDVVVAAHLNGYHGPAAYPLAALSGDAASPVLITVDGTPYAVAPGAAGSITVRADGSGAMAFDKLAGPPTTPGPAPPGGKPAPAPPRALLSGSLMWTCATNRPPPPSPTPRQPTA
jgi:hypothetical protein